MCYHIADHHDSCLLILLLMQPEKYAYLSGKACLSTLRNTGSNEIWGRYSKTVEKGESTQVDPVTFYDGSLKYHGPRAWVNLSPGKQRGWRKTSMDVFSMNSHQFFCTLEFSRRLSYRTGGSQQIGRRDSKEKRYPWESLRCVHILWSPHALNAPFICCAVYKTKRKHILWEKY